MPRSHRADIREGHDLITIRLPQSRRNFRLILNLRTLAWHGSVRSKLFLRTRGLLLRLFLRGLTGRWFFRLGHRTLPLCPLDDFLAFLADTNPPPVIQLLHAKPNRLATIAAEEHDVGESKRRFTLDDAALLDLLIRLRMPLDQIQLFDDHLAIIQVN